MHTTSPCTCVLCACCTLAIALVLNLAPTCHAQNSAVNFTSSQPVVSGFNAGGTACNNIILAVKVNHASAQNDLITTCFYSFPPDDGPFTAVLVNQNNGFFNPVPDSAIDYIGTPIQAADLNGDTLSDLIIIAPPGQGGPSFGVQMSNNAGGGGFDSPVYYTASGVPSGSAVVSAVTGDFEHNGRMDVAVLSSAFTNNESGGANNLTIFLNDGTGKLTQSATYPLNATPAGFLHPILVAGDINNDGKVDVTVVYTGKTGTAVPFMSQGNGKFTKGSPRSAGDSPMAAAFGDFNKDGFGDIAVTTPTGFNIIFGSSSGNFTGSKFTYYQTPNAALFAGGTVVPGDFDKDGNLDLAVSAANGVDIFWGAGNGTFSTVSAYSDSGGNLVAADINTDGKLDLVSSSTYNASILYNLGNRGFRAAPNTHSPYANGIVSGDFNRDGKLDVAVVNTPACAAPCNGTVTVLPGEGTYFNAGPSYTIGMHGSAIAAGDLNGDGILDLVVTNATPGDNADVSILLGNSTGGFGPARNLTLGSLSGDAFLVDVNGDGKLDLIEDGGVALGDGKGSFGNLTPLPDGIAFGPPGINGDNCCFSTFLAVADFNGDGHPDIAATWMPPNSDQQAAVLINDGKGNFSGAPFDISGYFEFITGIAAGPIHGGNINDLVFSGAGTAGNGNDNNFGFFSFLNDGKGNFNPGPGFNALLPPGEAGVGGVAIADFNKDGHNDIGFSVGSQFYVSTGPSFNAISTPFTATIASAFTIPVNTSYFAVADFNKDGWPDIVFPSAYGVSRLYNVPVPTVSPGVLNFSSGPLQKVTIKNTTTKSQAILAALGNGTSSMPGIIIAANNCKTLAVGASCTITINNTGSTSGTTLYIMANSQFIAGVKVP